MISLSSNLENAVPHVLYDLSIPLPERKLKAKTFRTLKDVGHFVGIPCHQLYYYRNPGKKIKAKDGKIYALRIAKKTA